MGIKEKERKRHLCDLREDLKEVESKGKGKRRRRQEGGEGLKCKGEQRSSRRSLNCVRG